MLVVLLLFLGPLAARAAISVELIASRDSPAPVATMVTWTAVADVQGSSVWYRFRARRAGEGFGIIRDFGPSNTLDWTASEHEDSYEIEVTVRNRETGETATAIAPFQMTSRVSGGFPAVSPTRHPLVWLYSSPGCPAGGRMMVEFHPTEGQPLATPYKDCRPDRSMNFYLAGMRPETAYAVWHTLESAPGPRHGPLLWLRTASLPGNFGGVIETPPAPGRGGILVHGPLDASPFATDRAGNVVWYYPDHLSKLTRVLPGGRFLGTLEDWRQDESHQALREFDLVGMTLLETNAARVNEQLKARGARPIGSFHHEVIRLPDGKILALASVEQILTNVQGSGAVNIIGDMIVVLDHNLQVVWTWDTFDHLDVRRGALLGEICRPGGGGCPPFYLAPMANDWTHGNAVTVTPDGDLLFSIRHLDWVVKIDYDHGEGNGQVVWRLGKDGDFRMDSAERAPWFSHQHDAAYLPGSDSLILLFDNGNTRQLSDPAANSRGQVLRLNERDRTASLVLNVDLGAYAPALGSAQWLPNGNYLFDVGLLLPGQSSRTVEVDGSGQVVHSFRLMQWQYRAYGMPDLYNTY